MPTELPTTPPTMLLISVQELAEVDACLAGGADLVDIKDPSRGPLGRPAAEQVRAITDRVGGARPVTVAAGDLGELPAAGLAAWADDAGARFVKLGLPTAGEQSTLAGLSAVRAALDQKTALAPVLYADLLPEPPPLSLLQSLRQAADASWLVVDTADKSGRPLNAIWSRQQITQLLSDAADAGMRVALAGRLGLAGLASLRRLAPAVLGVRGAVCVGGRTGKIDAALVSTVAALVCAGPAAARVPSEKT
ncbi:hypothetical protein Pla123a_20120 [Posidoniimonas polymericola]|uniref:(5-formylfuran-3-yl)methyl phosphate synthase n=1 Tax=Posidoniimonas polymericola TaxID=2528002 RepID=A0A5C5YQY9_9BACT|nr:(5-formylfuran-3-yl)methyl phosphate synthase [Posidoniimonas polymericola]TWT77351.1 hypothetical protein Pla123a_20120 [Posidoniimonas polymericola]